MGNKTELSFLTVPRFLWVKYAKVTREGEDEGGGFDMKMADYFGTIGLFYSEEGKLFGPKQLIQHSVRTFLIRNHP
jgi:hypothetical protein